MHVPQTKFDIAGSWSLVAWRRIEEGDAGKVITYPLGEKVKGLLLYTSDFNMSVQMFAADRPPIDSTDALGGTVEERAAAYSTCLAYFGTYEVQGDTVTHRLDSSLFPNWSGTVQSRPFSHEGNELTLRTPPSKSGSGTVVNEIVWRRTISPQDV